MVLQLHVFCTLQVEASLTIRRTVVAAQQRETVLHVAMADDLMSCIRFRWWRVPVKPFQRVPVLEIPSSCHQVHGRR